MAKRRTPSYQRSDGNEHQGEMEKGISGEVSVTDAENPEMSEYSEYSEETEYAEDIEDLYADEGQEYPESSETFGDGEQSDSDNDMNQSTGPNRPLVLALAIIATVIVLLTGIGAVCAIHSKEKGQQVSVEEGTASVYVNDNTSNAGSGNTETSGKLIADAYPEINSLVAEYYAACLAGDLEQLNRIVESDHKLTEDDLKNSGEYIEAYQNVICYTVKGPVENSYIVYVRSDVKLINIETPAPSLERMYVRQNAEGSYYICSSISDEMTAYAERMDNSESVRILLADVNKKFKQACAEDSDLNEFYNRLLNETQNTQAETVLNDTDETDTKEAAEKTEEIQEADESEETEEETDSEDSEETVEETDSEDSEETEEDEDSEDIKEADDTEEAE